MKQEKAKQKKLGKIVSVAGRIAFLVAIMFLISYLVTIVTESKGFYKDASARTSLVKYDEKLEQTNAQANENYERLYAIADKLSYSQSIEDVTKELSQYVNDDKFGDLRYYAQGNAYTVNGALAGTTGGQEVIAALVAGNRQGCTPVYYDELLKFDCMAFYVPVKGSLYIDGLLSIMKVYVWSDASQNAPVVDTENLLTGDHLAAVVMDAEGTVYSASTTEKWSGKLGKDFRKFIGELSSDTEDELAIQQALQSKKRTSCHIGGSGGEYVLTVAPIEALGGNLYLVMMAEQKGFIAPEMQYVRYVINLTIVAIVALVIGMIYAFFYYKNSKQALDAANYLDPIIGCANADKFRGEADKYLQDRTRAYAVAVLEIRKFQYIEENLQKSELAEALQQVAKVVDTFCNPRETYGYLGDGKFALLMLYSGEKTVRDRIRLIETVLGKTLVLGGSKSKRIFYVGVGVAEESRRYTAGELLANANAACALAETHVHLPFVVYNEQISVERANNDRIELEMESALANHDFRLFLQPKYGIAADRIDSAEALVRWFDPNTGDYRFPGEFISLFESNGFITKLDHYMYIEVLKYLQAALERGEKQVPISVNVSLITANEEDFLTFYIENKKKYGVPDDFIVIEFTEGFLMEDHQKLNEIVTRLHRNGIRCSLDDFGTGYASFAILKDVSFDEVKLDRALLDSNTNGGQGAVVVKTMVQLAKSLGMRVVQEGVETKETFEKVTESGCDTVQGYYYARAIPVEEYKLFLASNTSIKYKALVK